VFTPPQYLSPSSIRTFIDCPQKFKISRFDNIKEPPSWATHLGSFTHEVLEHLYMADPEDRTTDTLKTLAGQLWVSNGWEEKVLALEEPQGDIKAFKVAAFTNMTNLWSLEDPTDTFIDEMELEVESEVEGVRMKGYIDRLIFGEDETAIISDYKTGKVPNPKFNPDDKLFFQLLAYALMLEASNDVPTSTLELLYLTQTTKKSLTVTPAHLATATGTIVETKELVDAACSTGDFPCNVTNLCDWCHYKKIGVCPAWKDK
jgi:putative RecB family exonuclease